LKTRQNPVLAEEIYQGKNPDLEAVFRKSFLIGEKFPEETARNFLDRSNFKGNFFGPGGPKKNILEPGKFALC